MPQKKDPNFPIVNLKELSKTYPNRFLLSIAAAKRARQIKEGSRPRIDFVADKPMNYINIALQELIEKKYSIEIKKDDDIEQEMLDELNQSLEANIKVSEALAEKEKEEKKKDRGKRSKSLAA